MKKMCVCGAFIDGSKISDGQTIKTCNTYNAFVDKYGESQVSKIDTYVPKVTLMPKVVKNYVSSEMFLMLPAKNGLRVITPILIFLNVLFHRKLLYSVIGGWLPSFLANRPILTRCLKHFDKIFVETKTMEERLVSMGFKNLVVVPNFKEIKPISPDELNSYDEKPLRLVIFSRIMRQKGIDDAISVITRINEESNSIVYTLDIYGAIQAGEEDWFNNLLNNLPEYIRYQGVANQEESVSILRHYYALLFPTLFYTEGIPGTIIDAYAAGLPVISSRWMSFDDVVDEGITGYGYEFGNSEDFYNILKRCETSDFVNKLRCNCLSRFSDYSKENVLNKMNL